MNNISLVVVGTVLTVFLGFLTPSAAGTPLQGSGQTLDGMFQNAKDRLKDTVTPAWDDPGHQDYAADKAKADEIQARYKMRKAGFDPKRNWLLAGTYFRNSTGEYVQTLVWINTVGESYPMIKDGNTIHWAVLEDLVYIILVHENDHAPATAGGNNKPETTTDPNGDEVEDCDHLVRIFNDASETCVKLCAIDSTSTLPEDKARREVYKKFINDRRRQLASLRVNDCIAAGTTGLPSVGFSWGSGLFLQWYCECP